ncbi:MAG TPA: PAS domain-containing protein, partial [Chthoniobacterales bacterium]|nr:PAS domain-containing protein [Chthoniobacterales bacterium]
GIRSEICGDLNELTQRLGDETGAVLLAEEALHPRYTPRLLSRLNAQPPWSDLPLLILTDRHGEEAASVRILRLFGEAANVTLLERPLGSLTLVSTARTALRARRRQHEVRELLGQRETLLASISDAFSALGTDWRYTYVNQKVAQLAGVPREELIGRNIWEVFPDAVGTEFYQRCHRAMETRQADHFEVYYEPWQRWLETRIYPTTQGIAVLRTDITDRKRQETLLREAATKLRESEDRLRLAIEAANIGTFDYYPATGQLRFSTRAKAIFGASPERTFDYATYIARLHPEDKQLPAETLARLRSGASDRYEIEYRTIGLDDRQERWVAERGRAVRDDSGEIVRLVGTVVDFTERRNAEQAVRASETQLRFVTDHAASMLLAHFDAEERYIFVNEPYARRFGLTRSEIVGRTIRDVLGEPAYATIKPHVDAALHGERVEFEVEVPYTTGSRWIAAKYVPERAADGTIRSFIAVVQDTTERKHAELLLQDAKQQAEEANRAKDQFLAMLSHELRTPLTPVLMTIASLRREPNLPEELQSDLAVLQRNVELEALLIDDLLDLTRIAHGKLELHNDAADVHASLEHALNISASELEEKRITVTRQFQAREHHCWGDAARLQQVFWNVVKNAAKFTPHGGRIDLRTRNDAAHRIIVEITDNGIGIEPELMPRIFDAFEQGGRMTTTQYGGLGLGLAITKRVIDMHGGSIAAASEGRGKGATFTITLQAMETSLLDEPVVFLPTDHAAERTAELLLVEDHADTARVLTRILKNAGYRVEHADTVAAARELARSRRFDLVVSDLGLPDGSGLDLMQGLREAHGLRGIAL